MSKPLPEMTVDEMEDQICVRKAEMYFERLGRKEKENHTSKKSQEKVKTVVPELYLFKEPDGEAT